ncbi:MAG: PhoH family protein [bacterium]
MSAKKAKQEVFCDAPKDLKRHLFYGLELDEKQKDLRDAIWNKENIGVMVNAKAGTGKTLLSVATAFLMCQYGFYDGIVYIFSPTQESVQGFLPGKLEDKNFFYCSPLFQALEVIGEIPERVVKQLNVTGQKYENVVVDAISHTFLRGTNLDKKVVIIDEAQNFTSEELKKTLTRIKDNCKVIVIGHSLQCDIKRKNEKSGFSYYLDSAKEVDFIQICELVKNYRGKFSQWADDVELS